MEIWRRVTWLKISILTLNVIIVVYIAKLLVDSRRAKIRRTSA